MTARQVANLPHIPAAIALVDNISGDKMPIMKALVIAALCFAVSALAQTTKPKPKLGRKPVEAYRVIGNIYYVGATDVSSHIIVTSQGLILLDTGTAEMFPIIRANIEKLGHRMSDVKIILASHAHWDHVEGHAAPEHCGRLRQGVSSVEGVEDGRVSCRASERVWDGEKAEALAGGFGNESVY